MRGIAIVPILPRAALNRAPAESPQAPLAEADHLQRGRRQRPCLRTTLRRCRYPARTLRVGADLGLRSALPLKRTDTRSTRGRLATFTRTRTRLLYVQVARTRARRNVTVFPRSLKRRVTRPRQAE